MTQLINPNSDAIQELLAGLLGKDATTSDSKPYVPDPGKPYGLACYRFDDGGVAAVALCDLAFAARFGACLAMVPAAVAEDVLKSGELSPEYQENAGEVFNVLGVAIVDENSPHIKLTEVQFRADDLPDEFAAVVKGSASASATTTEVEGYGTGQLTVYFAP